MLFNSYISLVEFLTQWFEEETKAQSSSSLCPCPLRHKERWAKFWVCPPSRACAHKCLHASPSFAVRTGREAEQWPLSEHSQAWSRRLSWQMMGNTVWIRHGPWAGGLTDQNPSEGLLTVLSVPSSRPCCQVSCPRGRFLSAARIHHVGKSTCLYSWLSVLPHTIKRFRSSLDWSLYEYHEI